MVDEFMAAEISNMLGSIEVVNMFSKDGVRSTDGNGIFIFFYKLDISKFDYFIFNLIII